MAILKFVRLFDTGQEQAEVIDCRHYGVVTLNGVGGKHHEVTVHPGFTTTEGVTYRVSNHYRDGWHSCFVESELTGKTIDTIRPTDKAEPEVA